MDATIVLILVGAAVAIFLGIATYQKLTAPERKTFLTGLFARVLSYLPGPKRGE